jgi:hypothetical protein
MGADITGHRPAPEIVQLGVPKQQLNGAQILRAPIDQRRLGPSHRVRPVVGAVQAQIVDPVSKVPGVLSGPQMR